MADEPFTWGAGGARLTPEEIAQRRKDAAALLAQGTDPTFAPGTRGAGGIATQGLAKIAKALSAGLDAREADNAAKQNAEDNKTMIASLLGGGVGSATSAPVASAVPAASPAAPAAPSAAPAAPAAPSAVGKIYSNDEPSPLDPPSGQDKKAMIATILGEESTPAGQAGVANVIRNRAVDGGYGGNTPAAVVTAPNQFEPRNTPQGQTRMAAASADPKQAAAASDAIDQAYGTGKYVTAGPVDPTEGKTMFYSPSAQAALGRPAPSWAQGPGQVLGKTAFYDDNEATPANATPTQGSVAKVAGALNAPVAPVASGIQNVNPAVLKAITSPYADDATKKIAGLVLQQQMTPKEVHAQTTDKDGNVYDVNRLTGERKVILKADGDPTSVKEYNFYKSQLPAGAPAMPYDVWSTAKARAAATNVTTNVDTNSGQTYDKQLAEGLGKAHAGLANGVEDAQTRARDIAAMQGAIDQIQKAGGTTGGMAPQARLELQKSINAGAAALGIEKPFSEADISDKEFLTKFNRSMAGAQAKNAVGSRVTNFEMSNFLKANPGLDMTVTGNQRLLGIQAQIEQRNIAVGNAIRQATAEAISGGKKIDPVTVQRIITDYDAAHHIMEPTTGQDLTQSYALPEFQTGGNNPALSGDHATNVGKIRRWNPTTRQIE